MKFGKLSDIKNVDFKLPPDPDWNESLLASEDSSDLKFYLGCTGWSMPEWKGKWYPEKSKATDFAHHYGKQFNTIEFNTTHYRIPTLEQVGKWCESVPPDFKFCPKVPQRISHSNSLGIMDPSLPAFHEALGTFGDYLGCVFIQLPPYFGLDRIKVLAQFLEKWPSEFPLAVEVRHPSWFEHPDHTLQFIELLVSTNTSPVITDVAGRRDVLHPYLSNQRVMIRFVGNGLVPTDYTRIDEWCLRLKKWQELGLKDAFFFTHQPDNLLAPEMALYVYEQLIKNENMQIRGPFPIAPNVDPQMSLF